MLRKSQAPKLYEMREVARLEIGLSRETIDTFRSLTLGVSQTGQEFVSWASSKMVDEDSFTKESTRASRL